MNSNLWVTGKLTWHWYAQISLFHFYNGRYFPFFIEEVLFYLIFLRAILGSQQNWEESTKISLIAPATIPLSMWTTRGYICYNWGICINTLYYLKSMFTLWVILGVTQAVGLHKWIMTCIQHYGTTQSIFTVLKFLCVLPIYHHSTFHSLATTYLFTVYIVLLFPECHKVVII